MQELRREITGDRRVCLRVQSRDYSIVTIEVRVPAGWMDISLRADQDLAFDVARQRYRQRVAEQHARVMEPEKHKRPHAAM